MSSSSRLRAAALVARVALVAASAGLTVGAPPVAADVEGDTLLATEHGLRLELPRGWRSTEVSAYPGVIAWLARTTPRLTMVVTVDPVVGPCNDPLRFCSRVAAEAIDVLRLQLDAAGFQITAQAQSRAPELEYQSADRFLRHAVVVVDDQIVSVILAADSPATRAAQGRTFERLVQSIRAVAPPPRRAVPLDEREPAPP